MQVHVLPQSARPDNGRQAMAGLVRSIGRSTFAGDVFALAHDMIRADHVTAFCVAPGGGIRTVLAENSGARPIARTVAERYMRRHWTCDPVERLLAFGDASVTAGMAVTIDAADVEHTGYREDCYLSVNLNQRLSVADARDGSTMRLNFYRRRGRDFSQDDVACVMDLAGLLLAAVRRHDEDCGARNTADMAALFLQRLSRSEPALTGRERQVCALVAAGLTSEGIALRLNISLNTVITYRRRAYARLSISSQNELMRRLMV